MRHSTLSLFVAAVALSSSIANAGPPDTDHKLLLPFQGVAPVDQSKSVVVISEDNDNARFVIHDGTAAKKPVATAYLISPTKAAKEYVMSTAGELDFGDTSAFSPEKAKTLIYVNVNASTRAKYPAGTRIIEVYQMFGRTVKFVGKYGAVPHGATFRIAFASQDRKTGSEKSLAQLALLHSVAIRIAADMDTFADRSLRVKPDGTLIPHTVDLELPLDETLIDAAGKAAEYSTSSK